MRLTALLGAPHWLAPYHYHVLQPKIFTKPGWAKPECVVTFSNIAVQANVTVGEQCGNTQLLNGIKLLPCYIVTILCRANAEKVTHYCIVFYGNMRGPHCGIAPLLRSIGELHTGCKWAVIALNPMMSQVEGTFVKGREEAIHTNCGEKLSSHTIAKGGGEDLYANWGDKLSSQDQDKKDTQI